MPYRSPDIAVTRPPASATISAPRGDVPRLELPLPEPVEAPGRDVAEIERRRAQPPHRARAADESGEQPDDLARVLAARRRGIR